MGELLSEPTPKICFFINVEIPMKKLLLATAVAALSVSAANAAPTVYGKAFLTLDYVSDGDSDSTVTTTKYLNGQVVGTPTKASGSADGESNTSLNSNSSRIGIKGGEALTTNTDLVYQLEYGIDVDADDNGKKQFYSRDTYLGLANKQYGTLVAGRLTAIDDNINYVSQAVGQFDNSFGGAFWDGNRANNAMAYFSPEYNGLQFMGMYAMEEGHHNTVSVDDNGDLVNPDSDLITDAEGWGVGVKYEPAGQPFKAGATYIQSDWFKTARVSGAYDINNQIGVGALYQASDIDVDGAETENVLSVSGTMKTATPWTAYAQADFIKNVGFNDGDDSTQFVVGGKYGFNKATTGHIYAGYRKNEVSYVDDNRDVKGTGTVSKIDADTDGFGIGAGLEYKF